MPLQLHACAAMLTFCLAVAAHGGVTAELTKEVYTTGEEVVVNLRVGNPGPVGIESDFNSQSWEVQIEHEEERVTLGPVSRPGFYYVRMVSEGADAIGLGLFAAPLSNDQFRLVQVKPKSFASSAATPQPSLVNRFIEGLKAGYLEAAASKVLTPWLEENAVELGLTVVVCVVPGPQQIFVCARQTSSVVIDLAVTIVREALTSMCEAGLLTAHEAGILRGSLGAANVLAGALLSEGALDKALTGLARLTSFHLDGENGDANIAVKYSTDFTKKFTFLMKIQP